MVPILAYRIQEAVHGGLSRTARTRLQRLIDERPTCCFRWVKDDGSHHNLNQQEFSKK